MEVRPGSPTAHTPQRWVHDVITEHAALTTTGGRVWDAARRLCSFLEDMGDELGLSLPGLAVLELGSGLGWLGMTLARNLRNARRVVLTEQEAGGGLDWLRHNLALNAHLPGMAAVRAEACDWSHFAAAPEGGEGRTAAGPEGGDGGTAAGPAASSTEDAAAAHGCAAVGGMKHPDPASDPGVSPTEAASCGLSAPSSSLSSGPQQRWDLIIGSDLVYNDVGAVYLPRVMRAMAQPSTRILYCHTRHRFDTYDMRFLDELAACGLECREVREPSVSTPPPSPPPLTELFPEMRIAVYDIRLQVPA